MSCLTSFTVSPIRTEDSSLSSSGSNARSEDWLNVCLDTRQRVKKDHHMLTSCLSIERVSESQSTKSFIHSDTFRPCSTKKVHHNSVCFHEFFPAEKHQDHRTSINPWVAGHHHKKGCDGAKPANEKTPGRTSSTRWRPQISILC